MPPINTQLIDVPQNMLDSWQEIVDLIADITQCPASLIMRIHEHDIEVFTSSRSAGNPYPPKARDNLGHGLYCETVVRERRMLDVPNALADPDWDHNPDIKLGMVCYCGLPVFWPDDSAFGTICILDSKERHFDDRVHSLLSRFQSAIEGQLETLYHKAELRKLNQELEQKVVERTQTLADLSTKLLKEIEQRTVAEDYLDFHRHYDPLTKLPNRVTLSERLQPELKKISDDQQITLIYFSLRNFKSVNDSYGYQVGDQILSALCQRLSHNLPENWLLARIVGSEFVLVARHKRNQAETKKVISRVVQACTLPFNTNNLNITLQCHLGIALAPTGCDRFTELHSARQFRDELGEKRRHSSLLLQSGSTKSNRRALTTGITLATRTTSG
ncbi:conserved hypothetical protein [Vibrio mimicus VM573]|nr:conserved hypothetical protein [Vibrio mimicus VM573]